MSSRLPFLRRGAASVALAAILSLPVLPALAEDAPPVNVANILEELKKMKDQQTLQVKKTKLSALQQVHAAAGDPAKALEMWFTAVQATQFDGAAKESQAWHDWKGSEGEALKEKECQSALHLYYSWLALTLQRASGSSVKELLPAIVNYTKEATADQQMMEGFEETVKREKEMEASHKHGNPRRNNDEQVRHVHDQILRATTGSVVVQYLRIADLLNDAGVSKGKDSGQATWEHSPGSVDGIFQKIILPELRAEKDPRIVEYWDMKLKQEAEAATKAKLSFEADKFNQVRRPTLLWSRAQDVLIIGQRNRALADMFKIIQTYPTHPDAATWMSALEQLLAPPAAAPAPVSISAVAPSVPLSPAVAPAAPSVPAASAPVSFPPTADSTVGGS